MDSDGVKVDYYIGIRSEQSAATAEKILEKALLGNFPGSYMEGLRSVAIEALLTNVVSPNSAHTDKSVATVSIVPSVRKDGLQGESIQEVETFVDTMSGLAYTAVACQIEVLSSYHAKSRGTAFLPLAVLLCFFSFLNAGIWGIGLAVAEAVCTVVSFLRREKRLHFL